MTKTRTQALGALLLGALVLAGCSGTSQGGAAAGASGPPAYLLADKGCALLAGGGIGSTFADEKATRFWLDMNRQLTENLHPWLRNRQVRADLLLVPFEGIRTQDQLVADRLAQAQCSRLIQVRHSVDQDAKGPYFTFTVEVLRMKPQASGLGILGRTKVAPVSEYRQSYRYPRSPDLLQDFSFSAVAKRMYEDLSTSGVLEPLR